MKLPLCTVLLLLSLWGEAALAEDFALPDLTVEQPKHQRSPVSAPGKKPGLGAQGSQWIPDQDDKASKAFTPRSDFCNGCEIKLNARQVTRDDWLRRPHESFE